MPFRDKNLGNGFDGHASIGDEGRAGNHDIFFAAVELTRMPMVLTDPNLPDNPIIFANVAFIELTGYPKEEIIGRNCRFLQGEKTDPKVVAVVRDALSAKTDVAVEMLNYRKDGSTFWNALFISPVFGKDGNLLYYFASQLDVSRRRDAEDALRQAQKMEAVGQLTGGIAHDFNNLLTVVQGNISAASRSDSPERRAIYLDRAMDGAKKAEKLTSQLLAFARKQRLESRPVSLNTLATSMLDLLGRTLGTHIEIKTNLIDKPWVANIDTVQAETAIINLIVNARDAMPEGVTVTITTQNREIMTSDPLAMSGQLQAGRYSVMLVTDDGDGISSENLRRVTEPFFTTKEVGKGTGMGLAMVYGFMRQSKGRFHISSEVGQGTTIELWFPSTSESETHDEVIEHGKLIAGGQETILVVEDNDDVRFLAVDALKDLGYNVIESRDGSEALQVLASTRHIDVVFTDIIMPGGVNGVTVATESQKRKDKPKVLVTTGWSSHNGDPEGQERLGFPVLNKPYMPDALARTIRELIDGPDGVS